MTVKNNTQVLYPDLSVQKVTLNKTVIIGDSVYFMVVVTNNGDCALGNVTVSEIYNSTELNSITLVDNKNWTQKGNVFTYNGVLAPGKSANFTVWFKTLVNGTVVNTVNASSNVTGNKSANNNTTVFKPNMSVQKITVNKTVRVGEKVIFTIVVTNTGDCDLGNITVVEEIPEGLAYYNITGAGWSKVGNYVFNYAGTLAPGKSTSFNITFDAKEGGNWTNVVVAKSNMTEDKHSENMTFIEDPSMEAFKLALNKTVYMGNNTYFVIVVTNTGNCALHGIKVVEIFNSTEMAYVNHNKQNLWSKNGNVFTYNAVLGVNESANFTVWFKTLAKGNITNTINVTSDETENLTVDNTTQVFSPDLSVQKVTLNETITVGNDVYFMVVVTNTGDCDLGNVTVYEIFNSNELDSIALFNGKDWTQSGNIFTYGNTLTPGSSANFTIKFTAKALGNITNTVNASSNVTVNKTANNNTTVVNTACDVEIIKEVNPTAVFVNGTVVWTITVVNNGPNVARDVVVRDTLPDGVEVIGTISNGGELKGKSIVWKLGDLEAYKPVVLTFVTKVTGEGNITNVVVVNTTTPDTNESNNKADNTTYANPICDLEITKKVSAEVIFVNDIVVWTITVVNNGPSTAKGVIIEDTLPDGVEIIGEIPYNGVRSANSIVWNLGDLEVNDTVTISFATKITREGKNNNFVFVNSTTPDSDMSNNKANNTTYANPICDLVITKIVSAEEIFVNDTVVWTITVVNNGPSAAKDVVVKDSIPSGLVFTTPEGCTFDGKYLIWNIGTLNANASVTLELTTKVVRDGNITNIVVVNSTTPDSNESNNKANNTTYANPICDLEITKKVNATGVYVNDIVEWTIIVLNRGPSSAVGVVVIDTLPDGLEIISATPSVGGFDKQTRIWKIDELDNNESVFLILVTQVKTNNTFTNIVTVNSTTPDSNESNNHAQNTTIASPICDLEITKLVNASGVNVGDVVKWTITVVNNGPSTAKDVVVNDALPDGVKLLDLPEGCTQRGNTVIWNVGELKANASASITLLTQIITEGNKTNMVIVNSTTPDSNKSNNNANNTTVVNSLCDLEISKSVNASEVYLNGIVKWIITVRNNGPDTARDVKVTDNLPEGLKLISADPSVGSFLNGVWTVGDLANASSATLVLVTQLIKNGAITNIVTVNSTTPDSDESNNKANNTTVASSICDLEIIKLVSSKKAYVGDELIWTIVVINHGPSPAEDVKVSENIPDSLEFIRFAATKGTYDENSQIWTIGKLDSYSRVTLTIVTKVLRVGNITNPVEVSTSTPENDTSNNKANNTAEALEICDLEITISSNQLVYNIGDEMHWFIVVVNHGPSTAKDAVVSDILPSGVKFISYSASKGFYAQSSGEWKIGDLEVGETVAIDILCKVMVDGEITNNANVTSSTYEVVLSNNFANATIEVIKNETPDVPTPEPENYTPETPAEVTLKNTGNPIFYLLIVIFAIFGCFWANRKE